MESSELSASEQIDRRIAELTDWRGPALAAVRRLILAVDPAIEETWKRRGVPAWERDGILCTGEAYKATVKLTFAHGAELRDPAGLFNSSLDGNVRRAIDIREGDQVDGEALQRLIQAAIERNTSRKSAKATVRKDAS